MRFVGAGVGCVRGERLVFRGVDFALGPGEALLLTGPNGSGKSSLLRLMAGLLAPVEGQLTWDGARIDADAEQHRARLAFLGPFDAIKPGLTPVEDLRFWARLRGGEKVEDALSAFELVAHAQLPCRYLSTGQRRRLALSRLLVAPAALWLLDEPTLGLDVAALDALAGAIRRQRHSGGRVVLATHAAIAIPDARTLRMELAA